MRYLIFVTDLHLNSTNPASRIDNYYDAIFEKLEYVLGKCEEKRAALCLGGDLFNTPTQPDYVKNRIKNLFNHYKVAIFGVPGNHDLFYYNNDYIDRTSFKVVSGIGMIQYLNDQKQGFVKYGDWRIYGHKFGEPELPEVGEKSVILSHSYYDSGYKNDRLYTSMQQVYRSKARFICFGHDHNQYAVEENNGTFVVRPGALSRGTSNTENRVRKVSYAVLDLGEEKVWYEEVQIAKKFEEVFREKYEIERKREIVSFDEIQEFIDKLKSRGVDLNPYDILGGMGLKKNVYEKCVETLGRAGLTNIYNKAV